ncbi:MAG: aspartate-semialdehyde dehydrogenase [Phycisphaerales bacterium]
MPRLPKNPRVAIVGSTGAVGVEILRVLEQRAFPLASLHLLASERSAGTTQTFAGRALPVEALSADAFEGIDLALFCASGPIAREFAPIAAGAGAVVVDNSSAYRMDPGVALVVPEANAHAIDALPDQRIIANPNCSTIILVTATDALERAFGIDRIVVSTYQAVSGAGAPGLEELERLIGQAARGETLEPKFFPYPCVHNVFCHESAVDPVTGRNVEEQKMIEEARKIWSRPDLRVTATCVRVPVPRVHCESINLTVRTPATEAEVRSAIGSASGVRVVDDRTSPRFPMPVDTAGGDEVLVGRIRPDDSQPHEGGRYTGWDLFCAGDQLRKGAAQNAVQIAELLLDRG